MKEKIKSKYYEVTTHWTPPPHPRPLFAWSEEEDRIASAEEKVVYDAFRAKLPAMQEMRAAEVDAKNTEFRKDLEAHFATAGHPKADLLWEKARDSWGDDCSSFYENMFSNYEFLVDLIR